MKKYLLPLAGLLFGFFLGLGAAMWFVFHL